MLGDWRMRGAENHRTRSSLLGGFEANGMTGRTRCQSIYRNLLRQSPPLVRHSTEGEVASRFTHTHSSSFGLVGGEHDAAVTPQPSDRFSAYRVAAERRSQKNRLRMLEHYVPKPQTPYVLNGDASYLNFCSNDYLALATHPDVVAGAVAAAKSHGTGSSASRLVVGGFDLHRRLEAELAAFTRRQTALLFNSGFQANTSVIPAITARGDLVLCDRHSHASILHGCELSGARFSRFRHNNVEHLESLLSGRGPLTTGSVLIVTESIFSMDGDRAPLAEICEVAERHNALLMVDDAHAIGVFGDRGQGLAAMHERVDLVLGTFGKAFGVSGAFVACDEVLHQHLVNFCGGFIYTTAPPPPVVGGVEAALHLIRSGRLRRPAFHAFLRSAHERLGASGFDVSPSDTQIIPIRLGNEESALECAAFLRSRRVLAVPIRPPTVPVGTSRLRLSLTRLHTLDHIDELTRALDEFGCGR